MHIHWITDDALIFSNADESGEREEMLGSVAFSIDTKTDHMSIWNPKDATGPRIHIPRDQIESLAETLNAALYMLRRDDDDDDDDDDAPPSKPDGLFGRALHEPIALGPMPGVDLRNL